MALGLDPLDRCHGNALGPLDVLDVLGRGFGHMNRTAANHRAAGSERHEFRKGHTNRHKLALFILSGSIGDNHCRQHTPVGPKGQREVKATIKLTLIWQG